jgi:hypothetical protein
MYMPLTLLMSYYCMPSLCTLGTGKTRTILGLVSVLLHRRVDATATTATSTDDELSQSTVTIDTDKVQSDIAAANAATSTTAATAKASKKQRRPTGASRATRSHERY